MFDTKYLTLKFVHYILTDMFSFTQGKVHHNLKASMIDPLKSRDFHAWTKIREYMHKGKTFKIVTEWDDVIGFYDKQNNFVALDKDEKSFNKLVMAIKKF